MRLTPKKDIQKSNYSEGSVYQRKDGYWVAKYFPRQGAKARYVYGKSEAEARRKLRELKRSPDTLLQKSPAKVAAIEYFKNWLSVYKRPSVKASTYDRIESVINGTIATAFEGMSIGDITSLDCQNVINELTYEGKSFSAVKKVYDTMNACFKHAFLKKDINDNPMLVVECPSASNYESKDARALSVEEEDKLIKELNRKYVSSGGLVYTYRDAYITILNTGLRLGEMVALDWEDIDFESNIIHVRKAAVIVSKRDAAGTATGQQEQIIQPTPKSKSGNRRVPINKKAREALLRLKKDADGSPFVLNTRNHNRTYCNTIFRQLTRAYKNCMIPNAGVHTLRHTFATRLFERGADVKDVSVLLGHAGVGITYNTYIHVIKKRKDDVVRLLDDDQS